jgi:hypothetical protein
MNYGALFCGLAFVVGVVGLWLAERPRVSPVERGMWVGSHLALGALAAAYFVIVDRRLPPLAPFLSLALILLGLSSLLRRARFEPPTETTPNARHPNDFASDSSRAPGSTPNR